MADEQHGLTRSSVDCVQEEEEEMEMNQADEEALNTMCRYRTLFLSQAFLCHLTPFLSACFWFSS